jgi:hypothetical protein
VNGVAVVVLLLWVVLSIVCLFVGGTIGKAKGYPSAGYLLGLFFSFIGVIIIAVMPPSSEWRARAEADRQRREDLLLDAVRSSARTDQTPIKAVSRRELIAEAIRRDPSLAESDSPETLGRLSEAVAALKEESELRADLASLRAQEQEDERMRASQAAAQANEIRRAQASRWAAEENERANQGRRERQERLAAAEAQRLADLSLPRRLLAQHRRTVVVVGGTLVVALLVTGLWSWGRMVNQQATEAAAQEQALEDQKRALQESCGSGFDGVWPDGYTVATWASCGDEAVQLRILREYPGASTLTERFAKSNYPTVRTELAHVTTDAAVLERLAQDQDGQVRTAVASNPSTPTFTLQQFTLDGDPATAVAALATLADRGVEQAKRDGEWSSDVLASFRSGCEWLTRKQSDAKLQGTVNEQLDSIPGLVSLCRQMK